MKGGKGMMPHTPVKGKSDMMKGGKGMMAKGHLTMTDGKTKAGMMKGGVMKGGKGMMPPVPIGMKGVMMKGGKGIHHDYDMQVPAVQSHDFIQAQAMQMVAQGMAMLARQQAGNQQYFHNDNYNGAMHWQAEY